MQKYNNEDLNKGKFILMFSADWCGDCHFIYPVLPEIINQFPEWTFLIIDNDENPELTKQYDIFGIPSFVMLDDGLIKGKYVDKNRKTKEQIIEWITSLIA